MGISVEYGPAIHDAIASGDLERMKAAASRAESFLKETGDVAAALEHLRIAIARGEAGNDPQPLYGTPPPDPQPMYGTAIHDVIASGDVNRMEEMAERARDFLRQSGDASGALQALKEEIARLEGGGH